MEDDTCEYFDSVKDADAPEDDESHQSEAVDDDESRKKIRRKGARRNPRTHPFVWTNDSSTRCDPQHENAKLRQFPERTKLSKRSRVRELSCLLYTQQLI